MVFCLVVPVSVSVSVRNTHAVVRTVYSVYCIVQYSLIGFRAEWSFSWCLVPFSSSVVLMPSQDATLLENPPGSTA